MVAAALALAGGASAQVVARHVQDGELAVAPTGKPYVAYVRSSKLRIASRAVPGCAGDLLGALKREVAPQSDQQVGEIAVAGAADAHAVQFQHAADGGHLVNNL